VGVRAEVAGAVYHAVLNGGRLSRTLAPVVGNAGSPLPAGPTEPILCYWYVLILLLPIRHLVAPHRRSRIPQVGLPLKPRALERLFRFRERWPGWRWQSHTCKIAGPICYPAKVKLEAPLRERGNRLEVAFDSRALRTICENEHQATLELGSTVAQILKHRLADLRAALSVTDLLVGRPRLLDGTASRLMVVDLIDGYRLVFTANHTKNPKTEAGDLDWGRISRVKVLRIEDDRDNQ